MNAPNPADHGAEIAQLRRVEQELRAAHVALRESQRAQASLMSNLPGMAYRCRNDPDWTMLFVSEGVYALTGHRPDTLTGGLINYGSVIHADDRDRVWREVQSAISHDQPFQMTYRIVSATGTHKWVWERGSGVRGPHGGIVALEGFITDVTDLRRAQEEVARLNTDLEERVRQRTAQLEAANAELEAFAYSIAHDLRSPLTSIDGFSHTLESVSGEAVGVQGRHYIGRIRAGVRQMSDLTDAMLSLARLSRVRLRWEPVDLAEIARGVLQQLHEKEPQRIVEFDVQDGMVVKGDPRLLAQVIANLAGNAWKFSANKTRTEIRVGSMNEADSGPSGDRRNHDEAGNRSGPVFFVTDRGAGFDMAHASRLFGAFQRLHAHSEFEGTGIGLALVQKIVHRHGGRIWAEAQPGEGATFFFTLACEPVS